MDLQLLKKKLSVYRDQDGCFKNLSNEILYELLISWESWDGSPKNFYSALGTNHKQMASAMGRAKRYKREGRFGDGDFKEITVEDQDKSTGGNAGDVGKSSCNMIEFVWPDGRKVRFPKLDGLLEFMKKSA